MAERRSADTWSGTPPPVVVRRGGGVFSGASWAELLYAVVDLVPAIVFFVLTITLLTVGVGLSIIYVGLPLLALGLLVARAAGHVQRALAAVLLGNAGSRAGPDPPAHTWAHRGADRDPDRSRLLAGGDLPLPEIVLAPFTFAFALGFYAAGLGGVTYGFWRRYLPVERASDGTSHRGMLWAPDYFVDTAPRMVVLAVVGVGVLVLAPRVVRFFTTMDRVLIASLLGGPGRGRPQP